MSNRPKNSISIVSIVVVTVALVVVVGCDDLMNEPAEPSDPKPSFGSATVADQRYVAGVAIPPLTLPKASGGDGTLSYRLTPAVPGLTFAADARTLRGVPSAANTYTMQYEVRDTDGDTATLSFRIAAEPLTTLYWGGIDAIERAGLDGASRERLSPVHPILFATQVTRDHVYWTSVSPDGSAIRRADRDGRNGMELVATTSAQIWDLTVDVSRRKMYWTEATVFVSDGSPTGKVRRANLDGTNVEDVLTAPNGSGVGAVALDAGHNKIYWTEATVSLSDGSSTGKLRRANLDGTDAEDLVTGPDEVAGLLSGLLSIGLEIADDRIYFASGEQADSIASANLDGSGFETLRSLSGSILADITVDSEDGKIYWTEYSGETQTAAVRRAELDGSAVADVMTASLDLGLFLGIDVDAVGRKVVWTEMTGTTGGERSSRIREANLDGSAARDVVVVTTVVHFDHPPDALAVDVLGKKLYWAETIYGQEAGILIRRADLDGSGTEILLSRRSVSNDGHRKVRGFALDTVRGKMYWAVLDGTTSTIERADLDGTSREVLLTDSTAAVRSIALDVLDGKLLYSQYGTIRRANLDGTGQEDLVTDLGYEANSITIDAVGRKLYWIGGGTIRRANLDGTSKEDLVTGTGYADSIAVDAVGRKLYWIGGSFNIRRANLDGTGQEDLGLVAQIYSIALGTR